VADLIPVYIHLLRAKDLIDRRYADELDVPALARAAQASPAHFSRSFKSAFGETPHQYLLRRRIERAKDLLRETDSSVTDVSLDVGYASLSSFSNAFRGFVGESPGAYARRWRNAPRPEIPGCFSMMHTRPVDRAVFDKTGSAPAPSVPPTSDTGGTAR
jgi:AraC-like DNA-binding protein